MAWEDVDDSQVKPAAKWEDVTDTPQPGKYQSWMERFQQRPLQTAMQGAGAIASKAAPYVQAAMTGQQTLVGGGGPGDYAALPSAVAKMSGVKLPGANMPENVPQMSPASRFGPVIGTGVELGEAAVNKIYPGSNVASKIPDKSLAYATLGALTPGDKGAGLADAQMNKLIDSGITKGLRPSVAGKSTFQQMTKYYEKARDAVKTIFANKEGLNLTNEFGEKIEGLPKSLREFSQAIDSTKSKIFQQYDAMAQAAGKAGAKVDLSPIAKELEPILTDKPTLDFQPEVVKHAQMRMETLLKRGAYSTTDAQSAIKNFNNTLDAFYKNPNPETAGKAMVDAAIANNLRKQLDSVIEKSTEPGYQALKNKYGSLKAIEKDVNHRAIVDARKNNKGLIDFSDIFSGSEVINGILTLNPSRIAMGATAKGIASLYKHMNNPNTAVKAMFSGLEKAGTSSIGRAVGMEASQMGVRSVGSSAQSFVPQGRDLTPKASADEGSFKPNSVLQGMETYRTASTPADFDKAIATWKKSLKEFPNQRHTIIEYIKRAERGKAGLIEINKRKASKPNVEDEIKRYAMGEE